MLTFTCHAGSLMVFCGNPSAGVEQAMKMWEGKKISGAKRPENFCSCPPLFQFVPPTYWGHMPF